MYKRQGPHPAVLKFKNSEIDCKLKPGDIQYFTWPKEQVDNLRPFYLEESDKDFLGTPKGLKQILWERGLYDYSMNMEKMKKVLSKCPDFEAETCAFEEEVAERGHIPILSPKGHPELAGVGIEYCWGKSKLHFRRNNSIKSGSFSKRILDSICTKNVLFLERIRKFARKSRSYRRAYANPETPGKTC